MDSMIKNIRRHKKLKPNSAVQHNRVMFSSCQATLVVPSGSLNTMSTNAMAIPEQIRLKIPSNIHQAMVKTDASLLDGVLSRRYLWSSQNGTLTTDERRMIDEKM